MTAKRLMRVACAACVMLLVPTLSSAKTLTSASGLRSTGAGTSLASASGPRSTGASMSGIASVYSGGRTANGERALPHRMTAAHRTLPFGTLVKVTHKKSGKFVVVRINDRGPFKKGRVIDLTPAAARMLGFNGLAPVSLTMVQRD
jgi:rare lipoprotein A